MTFRDLITEKVKFRQSRDLKGALRKSRNKIRVQDLNGIQYTIYGEDTINDMKVIGVTDSDEEVQLQIDNLTWIS